MLELLQGCRICLKLKPKRFKVAGFLTLFSLGGYLIFFGYKIADRGFDAFERG